MLLQEAIHEALKGLLVDEGFLSEADGEAPGWSSTVDNAYRSYATNRLGLNDLSVPSNLEQVDVRILDNPMWVLPEVTADEVREANLAEVHDKSPEPYRYSPDSEDDEDLDGDDDEDQDEDDSEDDDEAQEEEEGASEGEAESDSEPEGSVSQPLATETPKVQDSGDSEPAANAGEE